MARRRPTVLDLAALVLPGLRLVRNQIPTYAAAWARANADALAGTGPLWIALGDSTAQGVGASAWDRGYVGQLLARLRARDPSWRVVNLSRSGARTGDVLGRQLAETARLPDRPALVTAAVGANDLLRTTVGLGRLLADVRALVVALPPGSVVATLPQGVRRGAVRVNAVIRDEAPGAGLLVADVWAHTGPPWRDRFSADRFHPNDRGYADWTDAFAAALPGLVGG